MANGLKFSPRKTALALAVAVVCAWQSPVFAHGSEAHMVPLDKTLQEFGADVQWDDYAQMFTLIKDGAYVKVKPGAKTAIVNGKSLDLPVPVVMKEGKAWVSDTFINDVFQSGLDQTFQVEKRPHPLNSLSAAEISEAVTIVKAAPEFQPNTRFTEISLHEPDKAAVWAFALQGTPVDAPRTADVVMLDGKHVIEAVVDLQNKKILSWTPIKGAHGMVLLDDFVSVQNIINTSSEFAEVLKKHGITDPGKVVTTPLTVGFFDGKDGLQQDARLLKVVSYLDTGDGNYWAHPIENLVAVVDLEAKKIIKIEEGPVIPVPMEPRPYDGRDRNAPAVKPLEITEPEGKNYTITGDTIHWQNWDFHLRLNSRVGPILSTVTYNDNGTKRQVMYEGSLGGMIVPYGDPDVGWYFKAYLDSGDYGMGTLTSPIVRGKDAPSNAVLLDETIADYTGKPTTIPGAVAIFERYAGPEYKHLEMGKPNVSTERRELVVRWISTVGNYDYIFDWVFHDNGTIGIDAGATGIEAVKGVLAKTMHDPSAKEDTRYGTLIDHNIVGTTHQHIYNFRLDLDVDGENQRRQLIGLARQHEVGTRNGVNQLLRGQLVTQRLGVLIGGHPHLGDNTTETLVVELTVRLERLGLEDRLLHLLIADAEAQLAGILIQKRLIDQAVQHLLAHGFHVVFVRRQLGELIAKLLLHTVTFAGDGVFKLPTANLLAIHFCGIVFATANQVTTHPGQNERDDNDTENNLEHDAVGGRA